MVESAFPHLNLIYKAHGDAKLEGGGKANPAVKSNKQENRQAHSEFLIQKLTTFQGNASSLKQQRIEAGLPEIRGGVPFLLRIPDEDDGTIEFIAEKLGIEIVAEYEEGFLIVATESLDLQQVIDLARDFAESVHGTGGMASILEVDDDPLSEARIKRLLDERLYEKWPFLDDAEMILDVSIESAAFGKPRKPRITSRTKPDVRARKESEYAVAKEQFLQRWDERRMDRENEIEDFVNHYGGQICNITDDSHVVEFPDSFSVRLKMSGKGFKDLIQNYPNLFEVTLPDDLQQSIHEIQGQLTETDNFQLLPPTQESPTICIIDSGIQEGHRLLSAAIKDGSQCFIPGKADDDIADYVSDGGHGTRVAGALLYSDRIPTSGQLQAPFWILNARVLDENNLLINRIFPPQLLKKIIDFYKNDHHVRIYNHSIASNHCCRTTRMSAWAAAIDLFCYKEDILFIQATGNLRGSGLLPHNPGILDHIQAGRDYPSYLFELSSRISNPAQSLQALTVGSISSEFYQDQDRRSLSQTNHPSSFTRSGFGLWHSIKPEVVECGGDYVIDSSSPPRLTQLPQVCPELVRSTLHGGPPYARDAVGTSYSTPKVAHIAGHLAALFPNRETLLYRALIVNSARWPEWAESADVAERPKIVQTIGYGIPNLERSTRNNSNRVTLITESLYEIKAKEGFIFGIPIPMELRRPGDDFEVRIDVTLSYSAEPRRTRKSRRGYLGVWLDWKSSKRHESFEAFCNRALEMDVEETSDEENFSWMLGNKRERDGDTDGVTRKNGTVQKDWTIAHSFELPDIFGIVVRGHKGWDRQNQNAMAKFSLVVSFEARGIQASIYTLIKEAIETEIESQVRVVE